MGKAIRVVGPGAKGLNQLISHADQDVAKVGFFASAKYVTGLPVAQVAQWMEKGVPSRSIPPRPFMRPTMDSKDREWSDDFGKLAKKIVKGDISMHQALDMIGLVAAGDVRKTISTLTDPPLSKLTLLARKHVQQGGALSGSVIGMLAKQLQDDPNVDVSGVSDKPLIDPRPGGGVLLAHVTNVTEKAGS